MSLGWYWCSLCDDYRKWQEPVEPVFELDCGHSINWIDKTKESFNTDDQFAESEYYDPDRHIGA